MAAAVVSKTGTMVKVTTPTLVVVVTCVCTFGTTVMSGRYGLKLDDLDALTSTVL